MTKNGADKRVAGRQRVLKKGKAITQNGFSVIDCMIRDESDTGARIICKDQWALPNEFQLLFTRDHVIRDVKVVWRKQDQIGVHYTSAERAPPRAWNI